MIKTNCMDFKSAAQLIFKFVYVYIHVTTSQIFHTPEAVSFSTLRNPLKISHRFDFHPDRLGLFFLKALYIIPSNM